MRFRVRPSHDGERGSLLIAMTVILILGLLGGVITARAIGSAFISAGHQNAASAVSQADAGLADALYRIDQGTTGTGTGTSFCVKAGDSKCLAASVPAASGDSYLATQVSSTNWLVRSMATVKGQTAAVQSYVTEQPQYPFVLFGNSSLNFNGLASEAFSTYDPTAVASSSNPNGSGGVSIGSNGSITCNGGLGNNVAVVYYGTGGVASSGTTPCGTYQSYPNLFYLPTPAAPSGPLPCPGLSATVGGVGVDELGTGYAGAPVTLSAGTYLCTTPVAMSGSLNVSGAVQLFIILDPSQYGSATAALTVAPDSYINDTSDYCTNGGSSGCHPTPDLPSSQNFAILTNSTGTIGNSNGDGFYMGAILYAPNASITENGCKSHYYGTVVIGEITCNGGPHLYVSYDSTLSTVYGPWTPGQYTQINPSTFMSAMTASGL